MRFIPFVGFISYLGLWGNTTTESFLNALSCSTFESTTIRGTYRTITNWISRARLSTVARNQLTKKLVKTITYAGIKKWPRDTRLDRQ